MFSEAFLDPEIEQLEMRMIAKIFRPHIVPGN